MSRNVLDEIWDALVLAIEIDDELYDEYGPDDD